MSVLMRLLTGIATIEFLVALYVMAGGAFRWQAGPLRISASDPAQPFTIAVICGALAIWLSDWRGNGLSWSAVARWSRTAAIVASLVTILVGVRWAVGVAAGADAYGYVSQASLWAAGDLIVPEPLAALEPSLATSAAPLGYKPALVPAANVPTYSPGLPLLMALALVGGPDAVYVVVPILGGLAVWCTFLIGERLAGPRTGLFAALLTASSPMFLFHLFEPMSDLPVTAWWLLAILCGLRAAPAAAFASGLAAAAAVLTRPNLVPLAGIVAVLSATRPDSVRRLALFVCGLLPGVLAVAAVNQWLYGSPLSSGYGPLSLLFSLDSFVPNMARYPRWLIDLHTAGILLAFAAPFLHEGSRGNRGTDVGISSRSDAWILLAFCLAVGACYVFYLVFPDWPALRFLLPAIPLLFVLSSAVVVRALALVPLHTRGALAFALCGLLGCWYVQKADALGVFLIQGSQRRYVTTGEFANRSLPQESVILTVIQSGTMRWYGHRPTLRWDQLQAGALEPTLETLRTHGLKPYLLVEDGEEEAFRSQFAGTSGLGQLDWPPAYELASQPIVRIYDPDDRARHLAGETIRTQQIGDDESTTEPAR